MKLADYKKLTKLMMLTSSENDNESLSALRAANAILKTYEIDWNRVFSRTVQVINEFEPAPEEEKPTNRSKQIDEAFETVLASDLKGSAATFIDSLYQQWNNNHFLSQLQHEALMKYARNAEERR